MDEVEIYRRMMERASSDLRTAVAGVTGDAYGARPTDDANSVNFIYFHVLRHWDYDINYICRRQEADADAWHRHEIGGLMGYHPLGLGKRGLGTGYGYTSEEVAGVPVNKDALNRYHDVMELEMAEFLEDIDPVTLDAPMTEPDGRQSTLGLRIRHLIAHTFFHVGDIEYVKGLVGAPPADLPTMS